MKVNCNYVKAINLYALLLILACLYSCTKVDSAINTSSEVLNVKSLKVNYEVLDTILSSFGTVSFESKTDLSVSVEANIIDIPFKEGMRVRKGDVVIKLRNLQLENRLLQSASSLDSARSALNLAEAKLWEGELALESRFIGLEKMQISLVQKELELLEAEKSLQKKEELFIVGGVSEDAILLQRLQIQAQKSAMTTAKKDYDSALIGFRDQDLISRGIKVPQNNEEKKAKFVFVNTATLSAEVEVAESRIRQAQMEIDSLNQSMAELTVTAPEDGIFAAKYFEKGERVQANTKIATIIYTGSVEVIFPLREDESQIVMSSMAVDVILDAIPDKVFKAKVDIISPVLDSQTGSITIKAKLLNPENIIRPGMFARVKVLTGTELRKMLIPENAITEKKENAAQVYCVERNKVFNKKLVLGKKIENRYCVEDGLIEGDLIVLEPSPLLKEGVNVKVE